VNETILNITPDFYAASSMKIILILSSLVLLSLPSRAVEVTATSYSYREHDHLAYGCRNCTGGVLDDTQVAADTNYYPLGTVLWVEGLGRRVVTDRGSDVVGPHHIDIHFCSLADMRDWGTRRVEIKVLSPEAKESSVGAVAPHPALAAAKVPSPAAKKPSVAAVTPQRRLNLTPLAAARTANAEALGPNRAAAQHRTAILAAAKVPSPAAAGSRVVAARQQTEAMTPIAAARTSNISSVLPRTS
jgi:3D (Asp-Asp-Asp) domain-containing protein